MGVRRLQTYLEQHCPGACYKVNIKDIANEFRSRHNKDPVIVVDGSSCFRMLYGDLDWVCGGQYKEYVQSVTKFIDSFENLGIKLVIFFDGATLERKRRVWIKRRLESMQKAHAVFDFLKFDGHIQRLDRDLYALPAGASNVMSSISKSRCMVQRSIQECDEEIASYADDNKCLAILAQDSDYVIYEYGAEYYLSSDNLDLQSMSTLVYDKIALARHLNLDVIDLPLLASLMGNDLVSADDLRPFHSRLTGRQRHNSYTEVLVLKIAEYMCSLPKGCDIYPHLRQLSFEVFGTPTRAQDLLQSIQSYKKNVNTSTWKVNWTTERWESILSIAHSKYVEMSAPSHVYNILRKLPFEMSTALEDFRATALPSAVALKLMRQRIYGVALREHPGRSEDSLTVDEWCMSGPNSLNNSQKVTAILPPDGCPYLLDLWLNKSEDFKKAKFQLLSWIASEHLVCVDLMTFSHMNLPAICILSYLYHDMRILFDWEVKVFATVVVDVQAMDVEELSSIYVKNVNVRGIQLATLFNRAVTHLRLANSICGDPIEDKWTRHPQLFDGKLFQMLYKSGERVQPKPRRGSIQQFDQICKAILTN